MSLDIDHLLERAAAEPARPIDASALRARAARARRRERIAAGLSAVAVIGAAAALLAGRGTVVELRPASPPDEPPAASDAPPAAEQAPVGMFLSHAEVSRQGQRVALAMTTESRAGEHGVALELERWSEGRWESAGQVEVHQGVSSGQLPVPLAGVGPAPGGVGPLEWVTLPALEPGWYRFARDESGALAPFQIVGSPEPVDPDLGVHSPEATLEIEPAIVTRADGIRLLPVGDSGIAEGEVVVEQADGSAWVEVARATPEVHPEPVAGETREAYLRLPDLQPGAYRLSATDSDGGPRTGYLFVTPDPET